ncbi:MAG: 2TM domain-containing protein [Burkholderiales bacterium]|jgi:hypothetical protein
MSRHRTALPDSSPEAIALARTRARLALRAHATVYAVVCTGLVLVWMMSSSQRFWPGVVIAGWGVAVALQALRTTAWAPGSRAWTRIHDEELARARRDAAGA